MLLAVPVYNEEKELKRLLNSLRVFLHDDDNKAIIVDDGSTDNSAEIIYEFIDTLPNGRVIFIRHKKNQGLTGALKHAFIKAIDLGRDIFPLVTIDGDGQFGVENIDAYLKEFELSKLDLMIISRDFSKYPLFKRMGNRILSEIASFLLKKRVLDIESGLRIMSFEAVKTIINKLSGSKYTIASEIVYIVNRKGLTFKSFGKNNIRFYRSRTTVIDFLKNFYYGIYQYFRCKHE